MERIPSGSSNFGVRTSSIKRTISRLLFGTSMPIYGLPGITSTTRTEAIDMERAKSREMLVTLEALTPGARSSSKRVTTGPGCASITLALTLNSCSLISSSSDKRANCSAVKLTFLFGSTSSSKSSPGKVGKSRRFCATCMARDKGRPAASVKGASKSNSFSSSENASASGLPAVSCQASTNCSLDSGAFSSGLMKGFCCSCTKSVFSLTSSALDSNPVERASINSSSSTSRSSNASSSVSRFEKALGWRVAPVMALAVTAIAGLTVAVTAELFNASGKAVWD